MTQDSIPQDYAPKPDFSKRYWLFGFPEYEASGGMSDFISSFDEIESAKKHGKDMRENHRWLDYLQIFDSVELREIEYFSESAGWWNVE